METSTQQQLKSGSWIKKEDGSLKEGQACFDTQRVNDAQHVGTSKNKQCAQWCKQIVQPCLQQMTLELSEPNTGSGDASDTMVPEMDIEYKVSNCQVSHDSRLRSLDVAQPDMGRCSKKRRNTQEVKAGDCNTNNHTDKKDAQRNNARNVLERLTSINNEYELTARECAMILVDLKHSGFSRQGGVQSGYNHNSISPCNQGYCAGYVASQQPSSAVMPPHSPHQLVALPAQYHLNTVVMNRPAMGMQKQYLNTDMIVTTGSPRDIPVRVYSEALQGCAAMFGVWVNRDSYWEGHHPRPLFRRCNSTFTAVFDPQPVEAFHLWNTSSVPAKVVLSMWMRLKLGEMMIIDGREVPAGTLFDEVIKILKENEEDHVCCNISQPKPSS